MNYAAIAASLINPWFSPVGFAMACHRLAPNVFAVFLYIGGRTSFTTDETKQFSKERRIWVALLFSILYLAIAVILTAKWLPDIGMGYKIGALFGCTIVWFGYLILLDFLDKRLLWV